MRSVLSVNEREALSRYVAKIITDIDKLSVLFESRGGDATLTRAAQAHLEATLALLRTDEVEDSELQACVPDNF